MLHLDTRDIRHDELRTPTDALGTDELGTNAITRLRPLLAAAGELDLRDREAWVRLRHAARLTTVALVAGGSLPEHLAVGPDDPPALVTRTIAAAWRHATSAPSRQERS